MGEAILFFPENTLKSSTSKYGNNVLNYTLETHLELYDNIYYFKPINLPDPEEYLGRTFDVNIYTSLDSNATIQFSESIIKGYFQSIGIDSEKTQNKWVLWGYYADEPIKLEKSIEYIPKFYLLEEFNNLKSKDPYIYYQYTEYYSSTDEPLRDNNGFSYDDNNYELRLIPSRFARNYYNNLSTNGSLENFVLTLKAIAKSYTINSNSTIYYWCIISTDFIPGIYSYIGNKKYNSTYPYKISLNDSVVEPLEGVELTTLKFLQTIEGPISLGIGRNLPHCISEISQF